MADTPHPSQDEDQDQPAEPQPGHRHYSHYDDDAVCGEQYVHSD